MNSLSNAGEPERKLISTVLSCSVWCRSWSLGHLLFIKSTRHLQFLLQRWVKSRVRQRLWNGWYEGLTYRFCLEEHISFLFFMHILFVFADERDIAINSFAEIFTHSFFLYSFLSPFSCLLCVLTRDKTHNDFIYLFLKTLLQLCTSELWQLLSLF